MNNKEASHIPSYFSSSEEESVDIKRYLSLFLSNWYWFAFALLISISCAYGINRWSERVYTVSSTLLIKDDKFGSASDLTDIFPGVNAFRSQQNLKNEIGILKSFNLNYKVIQAMPEFLVTYVEVGKRGIAETRLYKSCPFYVVPDSDKYQKVQQKINIKILPGDRYLLSTGEIQEEHGFGERFSNDGYNFIIEKDSSFQYNPGKSNKYYFYFNDPVSLANGYRNKLTVTPVDDDASLVILNTSGFVPAQESDYLNKLMEVYLQFGLDIKNETASQTMVFIEKQLTSISDSLKIAEKELEKFRLKYNLVDISNEGSIIQKKIEKIDGERSNLLLQKNYYEYLRTYINLRSQGEDIVAPSAVGIIDPLLIKLVQDFSQAQKQKRQLAMNLDNSSNPLRVAESEIETLRQSIIRNINDGYENVTGLLEDADKRLRYVEDEIRKLPKTERMMINIQRKFDINNTVYTFLLEKRAEAGIAKASNVPDNRIIDKAGVASSYMIAPKTKKNITLAIILGTVIPLFSILFLDYMNNKIIDRKDIEKATRAPVIGFISHNSIKSELPVMKNPGSTLSESFRSIRTNLKYFVKDVKCPVISISSTIVGEGKTFISANMASIIAMSEKKVLLLGLDLRKPRVHKLFNSENENGISNYLIGDTKYEDIIVRTEFKNLWYAPSGPVPPNPAELIESPAMAELVERAKKDFDFIIIDTPPVAIVTDTLLVSAFTDFYIFVVRQRYSSKNTLALIEELHNNENIRHIGIVINDINTSGYYGYGLRYGYSLGYGYSYGYNYYGSYSDSIYGYRQKSEGYYTRD